jgi:predicted enzyme related to lactoylglutathione lyase
MLALEVVPLPVTDIDRALAFYTEQAGFTLDVNYRPTADFRVIQLTPPGSACSVQLVIADSTGRAHNLYLVTTDIADARAKLIARGIAVGEIRHKDPVETWAGSLVSSVIGFYAETSLKSRFSVMRVPSLRNASASIRIRRLDSFRSVLFRLMFSRSMYQGSFTSSMT